MLRVLAAYSHLSYNALFFFTYVSPCQSAIASGRETFFHWGLTLLSAALIEAHVRVVINFVQLCYK